MAADRTVDESIARNAAQFATTHWSVVLAAGDSGSPDSQEALEKLCRTYWFPLYAFVRRSGHTTEDAKDLTQAFFAHLLERHALGRADQQRGRFRTFMLACLKNFLRDQHEKRMAYKRGGRAEVTFVRPDESGDFREPAGWEAETPELIYEREWAKALLERVMTLLEEEAALKDLFAQLRPHLGQEEDAIAYADLAAQWSITEGALRLRVHRMRERYRELLRGEIARTVAANDDIDDEIHHLAGVLSSSGP